MKQVMLALLAALAAAAWVPPTAAGAGVWRERAPMLKPRANAVGVVTPDRRIWVLGGYDARTRLSTTVQSYSPKSNSWRKEPSMPTLARGSTEHAVSDRAGRIYLFDGG